MGSQQQQQQQQQQTTTNTNTTTTTTTSNNNNNNNNNKTPPPTTGNSPPVFVGSNYNSLILNIHEDIRGEYRELHNEEFHNVCFIKWYSYSQER
jgi:hypothetical protein